MASEALTAAPVAPGPTPFAVPTLNVDLSQEAAVRAIANAAESSGADVVPVPDNPGTQTPTVQPAQAQPTPAPAPAVPPSQPASAPAQTPSVDVPAKFLKPDGTVDVEKLQASTEQLRTGIEQKELTIEQMVAQYREAEKEFRNLPSSPQQVARVAQQIAAQAPPQGAPVPSPAAPDPTSVQAQLMQDLQRDPVGTIVDIVKAVHATETKPLQEFVTTLKEQQRDEHMKQALRDLAKTDPRVAHPTIYPHVIQVLKEDPGLFQSKNPYKAAWNEVKERLHLGEVQTAQPSKTASPILGGGSPPPVPSTTGSPASSTLHGAVNQMKTKDEISLVEAELRKLAAQAQWGISGQ